ncbi:MAG: three-Cys-motif partner protein TcmP [Armatimonadetes bacterium]|nr:three-Cys-motif partner protein TcmP [Armatimonadota bacterium]
MEHEDFFDEASARSKAKARLVAGYFAVWSETMLGRLDGLDQRSSPIAYVDLCAGPGRYEDGTPSTPLLVLACALQSPGVAARLITLFNDLNPDHIDDLQREIAALRGVEALAHQPLFSNQEVGVELLAALANLRDLPALWFIDPWGFKELTLGLFAALVRSGRAELVFFFNLNRVNMALGDPTRKPHLTRLFGSDGLAVLQSRLSRARPEDRESLILDQLAVSLRGCGAQFVLPFRFYDDDGVRTSHYIVHATSSPVGHYLMSEVMSEESNSPSEYEYRQVAGGWSLSARIAGLPGWLLPIRSEETVLGSVSR